MRLVGQGYIYIYVGGVRSEYGIEPMGPIRGGGRAYPHLSPNQMHGWEFEEEGRRGWLPEEPYERIYLGKRQVGQLHQKTIIARLLLLLFLWEMIASFFFFFLLICKMPRWLLVWLRVYLDTACCWKLKILYQNNF